MDAKILLQEAAGYLGELQHIRREIHRHPETGFDLPYTRLLVKEKLAEMGYQPVDMGKAGIVATIGKPGKTILLRADMDALALQEEAEVDYKSEVEGKMHGCGHDLHTAMLLGAARLLKQHEDAIEGTIKLEFQPAEEIFQGSKDMIEHGLLENPKVDAAFMIHVVPGLPMPSGVILVPGGGVSMASCEQYHITVKGKGGHGSMPHVSIDPITAAAHIHLALQEINSRELDPGDYGVFTTCRFEAGKTSNVIPDQAEMWGTIRTVDEDNHVAELIKKRMSEICHGLAEAYRCQCEAEFYDFCPSMIVNPQLAKETMTFMKELVGQGAVDLSVMTGGKAGGGSEDFAFVSHKVPTANVLLAAGNSAEGFAYNQHHPKCVFDDSVLSLGSVIYAWEGLRWLEENKDRQ